MPGVKARQTGQKIKAAKKKNEVKVRTDSQSHRNKGTFK